MSGKKFEEAEAEKNLKWKLLERLGGFSTCCFVSLKKKKLFKTFLTFSPKSFLFSDLLKHVIEMLSKVSIKKKEKKNIMVIFCGI